MIDKKKLINLDKIKIVFTMTRIAQAVRLISKMH